MEVGGALPRRLVAALALADGMAVSDDRLAHAMWDDQPPAKAAAAMQAYVSRIHSALGTSYRDRLGRTRGRLLPARDGGREHSGGECAPVGRLMPGAKVELLDGAGHLYWWEDPDRAAALVTCGGRRSSG